jgi:hypothetical protein
MSQSTTIQIRPIQPTDKEPWTNLWNQYNVFYKRTIPDEVTEATFNRFLDPNNAINCGVAVSTRRPASSLTSICTTCSWTLRPGLAASARS